MIALDSFPPFPRARDFRATCKSSESLDFGVAQCEHSKRFTRSSSAFRHNRTDVLQLLSLINSVLIIFNQVVFFFLPTSPIFQLFAPVLRFASKDSSSSSVLIEIPPRQRWCPRSNIVGHIGLSPRVCHAAVFHGSARFGVFGTCDLFIYFFSFVKLGLDWLYLPGGVTADPNFGSSRGYRRPSVPLDKSLAAAHLRVS